MAADLTCILTPVVNSLNSFEPIQISQKFKAALLDLRGLRLFLGDEVHPLLQCAHTLVEHAHHNLKQQSASSTSHGHSELLVHTDLTGAEFNGAVLFTCLKMSSQVCIASCLLDSQLFEEYNKAVDINLETDLEYEPRSYHNRIFPLLQEVDMRCCRLKFPMQTYDNGNFIRSLLPSSCIHIIFMLDVDSHAHSCTGIETQPYIHGNGNYSPFQRMFHSLLQAPRLALVTLSHCPQTGPYLLIQMLLFST